MAPTSDADTDALHRLTHRIVGDLGRGRTVMVTGLPRSGRSHLIRRVADEWNRLGSPVLQFRGRAMLADRALSVLALGGVTGDEVPAANGGTLLARVASALETATARPDTVLLIDDAESVDRVSAGVIADVIAKRAVPALLACRGRAHHNDVVLELVTAAQPGLTVALAGLPLEDVMRLTNHLLDGSVGADAIARIATLSGGLPGLIEAITDAGRRSGQLVRRDDVWQPVGDLWDGSLEFSLLPFVQGLSADELRGLRRLAVAGDLGREAAEALVGPAVVLRLIQEGLVVCPGRAHPAGALHVFPPILGEWLRRAEGEALAIDPAGPVGANGAWPANLSRPELAAIADHFRTHWRAEVARCWSAWDADRVPRRAVPLLMALLSASARDERVALVFDKTRPDGGSAPSARLAALHATYRAIWRNDLAGALSHVDERRRATPRWDAYLRGVQARLCLVRDRVPEPASLELPVAPEAPDADLLRVARIEAAIAQGRLADAAAELTHLVSPGDSCRIARRTLGGLVMVMGDDAEAGVALAIAGLREAMAALDPLVISGYAYVAALGSWRLGRFTAIQSLVEVVHRLADTSLFQNHYKAGLLLIGSMVARLGGRERYACELVSQATSLWAGPGPFPAMLGAPHDLFAPASTPDGWWDAVDDLLERRFVASAVCLAETAAERAPTATRAAGVVAAGSASQSRWLRTLSRYVAATAAGESAGFDSVVSELREVCGPVEATRARVTWALALRRESHPEAWLRQADAAWRESARIAGAHDGLFARLVAAVDLTAREAEVAECVTRGLSSQDIARTLGVSTRTVEAYLHAVYRKTGVGSRDGLRRIARTWLSSGIPADSGAGR